MVNLVWRTDVHMSDYAPSSRTDIWHETVLEKLGQVRDVGIEVGASAIIDGGDFFHIKSPSRNSHKLVQLTAEHHERYPFPVYCCPGNHDSVYGDYKFLYQQPLGVLYSTGVFKRLYDSYEAVFEKDGVKVRVVGIPYPGHRYTPALFEDIVKGDEDVLICVAHILASLRGGTMFEGEDIVRYGDLTKCAPDVFCFGHWHMDQGVEVIEGKTFINIGSLTRGSLSQDEVQRRPACAVISCTKSGATVDVRRLKVKPAEEVFDVAGRRRQVERQMEMDSFVNKIKEDLESNTSGKTMAEMLEELEVAAEVKEKAMEYLEKAQ